MHVQIGVIFAQTATVSSTAPEHKFHNLKY